MNSVLSRCIRHGPVRAGVPCLPEMSVDGPVTADRGCPLDGRFSNRPFRVKHFQTFHCSRVDVSHVLALLFAIGTEALPSWSPRTRWNNLSGGLAVTRTAGPSDQASSPHPSSREGHLSTAGWSSSVLLEPD